MTMTVRLRHLILLLCTTYLAACTTVAPQEVSPQDPWQSWNRSVFNFNEGTDKYVLKPVATTYKNYVPSPVRTGIKNFFSNIGDLWGAVNKVLQGEIRNGLQNTGRFIFNSTVGLFGILDLATPIGLPKIPGDFGQTLGRWGVGAGPYVVLPFLGPSTLRDSAALTVDWNGNLWNRYTSGNEKLVGTAVNLVNTRANLLNSTNFIDDAQFDKYSSFREIYLQRRQDMVNPDDDFEK